MIINFTNLAESSCDNMEYYFGELFRLQDMIEPAKDCYESSEITEAFIRRAQLALQENESQRAINILKERLKDSSENYEIYFWLSRSYLAEKEFLKAEEYVLKYQQNYGKTAASFILLGDIYSNQNKKQEAYENYRQAMDIEPNNEIARYRKWGLDFELSSDNLPERIANWLKKHPGDIRARNYYSEVKKKLGENELASMHSKLTELEASSVRERAQNLLSENKFSRAESIVINYIRNNPENTDIVYLLGSIYLSQNKTDKVESLLKTYPDFAESQLLKARIKRTKGKNDQAVSIYWDYIGENPQNPDGYVGVGYLYLNSQRYELAIRDFKSAIYLAPQYLDAYTGICTAHLNKGNIDSVFYWSNLGLKYFPESFELLFLRAQAFYKIEEYDEVSRLLSGNISGANNYTAALLYLAVSYLNKNDYKNTIFKLEKLQNEISADNKIMQNNINLALNYAYNKLGMETHASLAREKLKIRQAEELIEKDFSVKEIADRLILKIY